MLLERCHGEQGKLIVLGKLIGGAGDNHRTQLFVRLVEVFDAHIGDGDKMCVKIFRVADD